MELLSAACALVREAGALFFDRDRSSQIREKAPTDYVTETDTTVQSFLQKKLAELDPDIGFLGEEQPEGAWDFEKPVWVLDPVDGTTNLIHAFPHSAVSLALVEHGQSQLGIVYNPYTRELFTARRGGGAFCNGEAIRVSGVQRLSGALVSLGTAPGFRQNADVNFARMRRVFDRCQDLRRMGAASLELCQVAQGRLDAFFEEHLQPWDYAAGMLVVQEAGGAVTDRQGAPLGFRPNQEVYASNGRIARELAALL